MTWQDDYSQNILGVFELPARRLVSGHGAWVLDDAGNEYLDGLAGIAVNSLGHAHPDLVAALSDQVTKLIHVSNYFATDPQIALAKALVEISGAGESGKVFFANSGTEANEAAFKIARKYGGTERPEVIALNHAFHGRSFGALSLTPKSYMQDPFAPMASNVTICNATIADLERAVSSQTAAVFLEPIQGEAGVFPLGAEFLQAARKITADNGALLVVDEVQTGIGRTGQWFGHTSSGIEPDVVTMAKGLGGGVPIGAVLTRGTASEVLVPGEHGSTFGGNPLATRAGQTVLEVINRDNLLENVRDRGTQLSAALAGSEMVAEVRGAGLLLGVQLRQPIAKQVVAAALEMGLIVNAPLDDTLRIAPPLIVSAAEIDELAKRLLAAIAQF